ncbi:hypothetical protein D0469_10540 [Peribacillus saganii]|uniref:Uncharacterized protein n=1 Tax=Peribacillus saganii TaxID=2303992 RepID=A0A372LN30_9BACI|nr:hypothetical protein D0469_10540 [Peribacillus saganii]
MKGEIIGSGEYICRWKRGGDLLFKLYGHQQCHRATGGTIYEMPHFITARILIILSLPLLIVALKRQFLSGGRAY